MPKPPCPCLGCGERNATCHGRCGRYDLYRKRLDEWKDENQVLITTPPVRRIKKNPKKLSAWNG